MFELIAMNIESARTKQAFYSELLSIAQSKNYNDRWASHKYKEKFGVWPTQMKQEPLPPSIATLNWIKHRNIVKARSMKRKVA